ncbi:MAG TPA: carbon-nitrogen hydrolase family protein [Aeromicrobium sp.]|nr:carbon-nitrogen hydrolase family protein [Aeromicrobium sp.]
MTLSVATAQLASTGDVGTDISRAAQAVDQAAAAGARLVVLPELFLGGYRFPPVVVDPDDPRLQELDEVAAERGVTALVGACLDGTRGRTISLLELGRGIRHVYDKQNPCGDEAEHVVAGHAGVLIDVDGWSVGLSICYDGCFPEHARSMAVAGAELYVASVAYFSGSAHRREVYYRARAVENGMYVAVSGLAGQCAGQAFDGGSAIYDPEGRILASVESTEGIAVARLDQSIIAATRAAHPMLADLREPAAVVRR